MKLDDELSRLNRNLENLLADLLELRLNSFVTKSSTLKTIADFQEHTQIHDCDTSFIQEWYAQKLSNHINLTRNSFDLELAGNSLETKFKKLGVEVARIEQSYEEHTNKKCENLEEQIYGAQRKLELLEKEYEKRISDKQNFDLETLIQKVERLERK